MCESLALAVLFSLPPAASLVPGSDSHTMDSAFEPTSMVQPALAAQPGRWDPTRFDSATAVGVKALLDSAVAHGLPYGQLYSNALMGASFKNRGPDIIRSTRAQFSAMLDARAALGENSTESELSSGADALRAGMDGKALQAIRLVRPTPGSSVTALVVAADFLKRGIPAAQARDAITSLARASKSDDALNAAQSLVARNAERGPSMARDALDRYVKTNAGGAQKNAPGKLVTRPPGPPDEL